MEPGPCCHPAPACPMGWSGHRLAWGLCPCSRACCLSQAFVLPRPLSCAPPPAPSFFTCSVLPFSFSSACPLKQIWAFPGPSPIPYLLVSILLASVGHLGWTWSQRDLALGRDFDVSSVYPPPTHPPRTNGCSYGQLIASGSRGGGSIKGIGRWAGSCRGDGQR